MSHHIQLKEKEVGAVGAGFPVQFSSFWSPMNCRLAISEEWAWSVGDNCNNEHQFVQVCLLKSRKISKLVIMGKGGNDIHDHYVKSFTIEFTNNGVEWHRYKDGEVFQGCEDRHTPVVHQFKKFKALAIKVIPKSWNKHIEMRLELVFKKSK